MWIVAADQTPFEQVFGPVDVFVRQSAPAAVSLLGTIIAFVCLLWSVAHTFWHGHDEDWRPKVMAFVRVFVVVALIAHSGDLINGVRQGMDQAYNAAGAPGAGIRQVLDDIRDHNAAVEIDRKQPKPGALDLWGQMKAALNDLGYAVGRVLTTGIWVVVWFVRLLQDVFVVMLSVLMPLALGLAVTPWFSSIGVGLISSLVGVLFWPLGFLLVDTFTLAVLRAVLQALNNYSQQLAAGENGLAGVFGFMAAVNTIGVGIDLTLIGLVMLILTVVGYYAAIKTITSLFGSAGGAISSGIGALGKVPGLAASAAAMAAGGATVAAGGVLAGLGSGGGAATPTLASAAGNGAGPGPNAHSGTYPGSNGHALPTIGSPQANAVTHRSNPAVLGSGSDASGNGAQDAGGGDWGSPVEGDAPVAPPRRSLAGLGQTMQRAGLAVMAGGASRTMRQAMKHSAANALVDATRSPKSRRSLEALEDDDNG